MKVLITSKLPQEVVRLIQKEHETETNDDMHPMSREKLLKSIQDKDGLLCNIEDAVDAALLEKSPRLKMIANYGVGFNNIDVQAATRRLIPVSNTPGVLTDATADTAFALILATARRIVEGDKMIRRGEFQFWSPLHFLGRQVSGMTLGIIGMGRIGKAVARRAKGFDMKIIYYDSCRCAESDEKALGAALVNLDTLLSSAEFISLHVPLIPETHHFINQARLDKMKPTAFLINTSRGPVVDEQALYNTLKAGKLAGAGLDVYEQEPKLTPGLTDLDNVVLLPHIGSATFETRTKMAYLAAENLLAGLRGEVPPNCVNCSDIKNAK